MDAIIWNVRSVNTMQAFERLITMHRQHHFEFIGILEPMQQSSKMERYTTRIGLAQAVVNVSNKIGLLLTKFLRFGFQREHIYMVEWEIEDDCIFKRLDRCLGNIELQQTFPGLEITHLSKIGSDHCPMQLKCDMEVAPIKKSFRFLNFWTKHDTFKAVVKENWNANFAVNPFILFNHKLKKLVDIQITVPTLFTVQILLFTVHCIVQISLFTALFKFHCTVLDYLMLLLFGCKMTETKLTIDVIPVMSKITENKFMGSNYMDWSKTIHLYLRSIDKENHLVDDLPKDETKSVWLKEDAKLFLQIKNSMHSEDLTTKQIIGKGSESGGLYVLESQVPKSISCSTMLSPFD
uniref:Uncharacterized protein LOC104224152 n=1 Tax=Nicotiana sylvestris TaxID=4096 RepID=A0A1U7W1W5_NICSY